MNLTPIITDLLTAITRGAKIMQREREEAEFERKLEAIRSIDVDAIVKRAFARNAKDTNKVRELIRAKFDADLKKTLEALEPNNSRLYPSKT